jgi:hypothetical protein
MELDINFPIMARVARPKLDGEYCMLVAHTHRVDVPEVRAIDTEVALPPLTQLGSEGDSRVLPELRLYDGRLFRFLGPAEVSRNGDVSLPDLFLEAFGKAGYGNADFVYNSNAAFASYTDRIWKDHVNRSPIARPIHQLYQDRLCSMSMDGADKRNKTWPRVTPYAGYAASEALHWKDALDRSRVTAQDDIEEALAMHQAQAARLLLVDDGIWYETRTPCIEVDTTWPHSTGIRQSVVMRYRYMPETMEQAPTVLYFPIHQADQAREAAERFRQRLGMESVTDVAYPYEATDHPAFDIDTVGDLIHRTGQALSTNLLKHIIQRPDRSEHIDAGWVAGLTDLYNGDNHILGRRANYSDHLPKIVDHFLGMYWNKFTAGLARMSVPQMRQSLPLVVEMIDDLPISLGLHHSTGRTPT